MDTRRRTAVKAAIWTALGFVMMTLTGLVATGSAATGGGLAAVNTALGALCYVIYERVWSGIGWGRAHGG